MKKKVTFPGDLLQVKGGTLFRMSHGWTLELPLQTFDLPCGFECGHAEGYRQINTRVHANFAVDLAKLGHRPVRFKPQSDKIEASVYLVCAHHPIDFTTIDTSDFPREDAQSGTLRWGVGSISGSKAWHTATTPSTARRPSSSACDWSATGSDSESNPTRKPATRDSDHTP